MLGVVITGTQNMFKMLKQGLEEIMVAPGNFGLCKKYINKKKINKHQFAHVSCI